MVWVFHFFRGYFFEGMLKSKLVVPATLFVWKHVGVDDGPL